MTRALIAAGVVSAALAGLSWHLLERNSDLKAELREQARLIEAFKELQENKDEVDSLGDPDLVDELLNSPR